MKGFFLVHQSLLSHFRCPRKSNDSLKLLNNVPKEYAWLFRNAFEHPVDPNWERGLYCRCKETIRRQREKVNRRDWLFDVVYDNRSRKVIRSAFEVSKVRDCKFDRGTIDYKFSKFYFVKDPNQSYVVNNDAPSRGYKELEWGQVKKLIKGLRARHYGQYRRGQIPTLIQGDSNRLVAWKIMKLRAKNILRNQRASVE